MLATLDLILLSDGPGSLRTRGLLLIGFIVVMFLLAGVAFWLGKRRQAAKNARDLSADTGSDRGATRGGDQTFSSDWLTEATRQEDTPAGLQSWQEAFLGAPAPAAAPYQVTPKAPGSRRADVPVDSPSPLAGPPVPPALPVPPAPAAPPVPPAPVAPPVAPAAPAVDGSDDASDTWWAQAMAEDND